MDHDEAIALVRSRTQAFAASLAAAAPSAPVPTCPGWTVETLTDHLGRIHRWAAHSVRHGSEPARFPRRDADSGALAQWYADAADELVAALTSTAPEKRAWSFSRAHQVAGFWSRRQLHETTIHLLDLQLATGETIAEPPGPSPAWLEPDVAADGVGEVLEVFLQRGLDRMSQDEELQLVPQTPPIVVAVDEGPSWTVSVDGFVATVTEGADPAAVATVSGPATHLYLSLWRRADRRTVTIAGDRDVAAAFLAAPLTP